MYRLLAIFVLLATASDETHGHIFRHWVTRSQLSAPWQPAADALAGHDVWSKSADGRDNSVMYGIETKQVLFVFNEVPDPITPSRKTTNTGAPSASTRAPTTSTSVSTTSTSAPTTSTSASITSTSALTTSTSAPTTSTNTSLPPSTVPPGYTYYTATGSYYKLHHEMEKSWYYANDTCASEGAHLTVLNDAEEADIIRRIVRETVGDNYGTWLGLRDSRPGGVSDWRTVYGEPLSEVFHEWYAGRPYNDLEIKCALFSATSIKLFDRPCNDYLKWYFTCERSQ